MSHLVIVEGLDPSTAIDKAVICLSVMNEHGAQIKMKRGDWPWVTERQPDIYNPEITQRLFAAADERQFALFTADELVGRQIGFLPLSTFFVTNPLGSPKLKLDERFRLKSPADCVSMSDSACFHQLGLGAATVDQNSLPKRLRHPLTSFIPSTKTT
jgi:hypothetical protein